FMGGNVTGATNAGPISITTAAAHGLATGTLVKIAGVQGNTAANGVWTITVTGATTFTLNGSTGSGAFVAGGATWAVAGTDPLISGIWTLTITDNRNDRGTT